MNKFAIGYGFGRRLAVGAGGLAVGASAFAVDPASGLEAVGQLSTSAAGYGPVMYGIAVTVVGILVAVKWIHRARGAA